MALNPLAPVTDYQSMLNRIFWFTSAAALGAVGLLRANVPAVDAALERIDLYFSSGAGDLLPIPAGYLLPALGIGLFARVYRLHGQLSLWLGISERFDVDVIMPELARQVEVDIRSVPDDQWLEHRDDVMRHAFYRFAGGNSPQIDADLIQHALDLWSWFWIGVQATVVFVVTGLVLIASQSYSTGALTIAVALLLAAVGLPSIRQHCRRYAIAQVKAIVADPARAVVVRQAFDWVEVPRVRLRRSA